MMKNFKLFLLSFLLVAGFMTSCTNDEPVVQEPNTEDSAAITTSLSALSLQFNSQGDVEPTANPSGNIVFDFCFDFVYPLTLSYNNGTTVTVESLEDLVVILINSNSDLFINGIAFPFDVEAYDDDSDAIVIVTINDEEEFIDLLEDCDFDIDDDCFECYEEDYDPVCVEITDPNGETFFVTYPNECYALCDGFTEDDFSEDCENDYNNTGGYECFTFNFPLTIITDDGETITVNSQTELDTALYNSYYFDFVYPFSVTDDEGEVEVIEDEEDFIDLLEDCYDEYDDDDCECYEVFDPVCVEVETASGQVEIYTFPNDCYALCEGFDESDFIDCEDINNPGTCSEEDLFAILTECDWYLITSLWDNVQGQYIEFYANGTLEVYNENGSEGIEGEWSLNSNASTDEVFVLFGFGNTNTQLDELGLYDWTVVECNEQFIALASGDEFVLLERDCE